VIPHTVREELAGMAEIRTQALFTLALQVAGSQAVGKAPGGDRRVGLVAGGTFEGPRLKGKVLPGGSDWIIVRPDGCMTLDVRLVLETHDGALIGMTYRGLRHGPSAVMKRVNRGETVDPSEYYFRTLPWFETASEKYEWLNRILTVAIGRREPAGPVYDVFQIL
jgi:hypothetical protein